MHKWESDVESLEGEESTNPSKILGLKWDKREDKIEIQIPTLENNHVTTRRDMLSYLGKMDNPLGIISPTSAKRERDL